MDGDQSGRGVPGIRGRAVDRRDYGMRMAIKVDGVSSGIASL